MIGLSDLPYDVMRLIFNNLEWGSLLSIRNVNRGFRETIQSIIFKNIFARNCDYVKYLQLLGTQDRDLFIEMYYILQTMYANTPGSIHVIHTGTQIKNGKFVVKSSYNLSMTSIFKYKILLYDYFNLPLIEKIFISVPLGKHDSVACNRNKKLRIWKYWQNCLMYKRNDGSQFVETNDMVINIYSVN